MIFASSKSSDGNMSFVHGNLKEVLKNREKFFKKLKINTKKVAEVKQTHNNKVLVADIPPNSSTEADGLITNKENVLLMIKIADCMAISFYDSKHKAIALIHAGFRGLENGIIKNVISLLEKNFNTDPKDLLVKISPSIGPCCYRMDIWQEAENQLVGLGLLPKNIDNPRICTYESKEYFSHRRSANTKTKEDRFVTIAGL